MVRTQIQLAEEHARRLRELAVARRESVASLIRQAVDQFLSSGKPDRAALYRQARPVIGKYTADGADVAVDHDNYLDEAFGS